MKGCDAACKAPWIHNEGEHEAYTKSGPSVKMGACGDAKEN